MDMIKTYENGLTLIVSEGGAMSASFSITIGTGSVNETKENNGISHYAEHMSFKGTDKYSASEISETLEACGASFNAYTGSETTCFYAQTIKENLETVFSVMADGVFKSVYPENEAEKEKRVIIEEISMCEDTPDDVCFDLSNAAYFGNDGYGQTILGPSENVLKFTRSDVEKYLGDFYVSENTVVAFAGNVTEKEAEYLTEKYVLPFVKEGKVTNAPAHNTVNLKRNLKKDKDIEQTHFCIMFPSPSFLDCDRLASEMATSVLGGGMSSRLFRRVREELGLAYSVYAFASRSKDVGTASVYAGVNSDSAENAYFSVLETISEVRKSGISEAEFLKAKSQLKSSTVFSLERPSVKTQLFSKHYLLTGGLYDVEERMRALDKVTKSEVEKAFEYFNVNDISTAIVGKNVRPLG